MANGSSWVVYGAYLCEATLRGSHGLLALDLPHCARGDSVCCWSKIEEQRLEWNGHRYVIVSDIIVKAKR
jgi:hypothetical protein